MWFSFRRWLKLKVAGHRTPLRNRARLQFERLDERVVPALITVQSTGDATGSLTAVPGGFTVPTLRAAIDGANLMPGADTITFATGLTGNIDLSIVGDTTFGPSAFLVSTPITIDGLNGAAGITITRDSATAFRLFSVSATGNLTLQNVTLTNGLAQGGAGGSGAAQGGGGAGLGGAIFNAGTLALVNSTLSGNQAVGGVVGTPRNFFAGGAGGGGGGMGGNGGNSPTDATSGAGGGGTQTNGADAAGTTGGAGGTLAGGSGGGPSAAGGNATGFGGGGGGGGVNAVGGSGGFGGGAGAGAAGGGAAGFGGGASGGASRGSSPGFGGGNERYLSYGGGGGGAGMGGAVFNLGGSVTVTNSTLTGNTARGGDGHSTLGAGGSGFGGALFNLNGSLVVQNSTLAANGVSAGASRLVGLVAPTPALASGGAIFNLAFTATQGVTAATPATLTLVNSILTSNIGGEDLVNIQQTGSAGATVTAVAPNIVESRADENGALTNGAGIIIAKQPLGPLANNGGPTQTMALLGGPAINAGNNGLVPPSVTTDQRGLPRFDSVLVDLGAFESQLPVSLVVDTTSDVNDGIFGPGQLSLREAIDLANTVFPGPDTITFAPGLAGQTIATAGNDTFNPFAFGPTAYVISSDITITGLVGGITIDGQDQRRLFGILSGAKLTLDTMTLTGGRAKGGNGGNVTGSGAFTDKDGGGGGGGAGMGGAIFNLGELVLRNSTLTGNTAVGGNGGVAVPGGTPYSGGGGGGPGGDGGMGNPDGAGGGGGVGGNGGDGHSVYAGHGIGNSSSGGWGGNDETGGYAFGGGRRASPGPNGDLYFGELFGSESGSFGGGGGGGTSYGGLDTYTGGNGTSLSSGGLGGGGGGGANQATAGAGGFGAGGGGGGFRDMGFAYGQLRLIGIHNGGFGGFGGGAGAGNYNGAGFGGGGGAHPLPVDGNGGILDVREGGGGAGMGGAIFNKGGIVTITNSTLAQNTAQGGTGYRNGRGLGGAIFNYNGTLTLLNSTVSGNLSGSDQNYIQVRGAGRGILSLADGTGQTATVTLTNSIVGQADTAIEDFTAHGINGGTSTATGDGNLIRRQTGFNGTILSSADPLLDILRSNGGPTQTMALLPGSPAINAVPLAGAPTTDQRGLPRGNPADVGAFELQGQFLVAIMSGDNQDAAINADFAAPLVVTVTSTAGETVTGGTVTFTGPASGAGITANTTVALDASGTASLVVTANGIVGAYQVTAATQHDSVSFSLKNHPTVDAVTFATPFVGNPYSQTITTSGQTDPYTYTLTGGALPPGLSLRSDGVLEGTPTTEGTYNFTVTATDTHTPNGPFSGSRGFSLQVERGLIVDHTTDENDGDFSPGNQSLREAIERANQFPDANTITFAPSITASGPATLNLSLVGETFYGDAAFAISSSITILGPNGANGITIARDSGAAPMRLFTIYRDLTLERLTLSNGLAQGGDGEDHPFNGGAGGGGAGLGGAIFNLGTLNLTASTLRDNRAQGGDGGNTAFVPTSGYPGVSGGGPGGGPGGSGNLFPGGPPINGGPGTGSSFGGGGGGGSGTPDSLGRGGAGGISTFGGGGGGGAGGFVFSGGSTASFNRSGAGGTSSFGGAGARGGRANVSPTYGGGQYDFAGAGGGGSGFGGAIFNYYGSVNIINSTLAGNVAAGGQGGVTTGLDDATNIEGGTDAGDGQGLGGAIFNYTGPVTIVNSTISNNTASEGGRGVYSVADQLPIQVNIRNTIIGQADTLGSDFVATDSRGGTHTTSGSGNIIRTAVGFDGTVVSTADPKLSPLANNGGPTPTMAISRTGPAYNAGTSAGAPATDQRGVSRSGAVDIGAVELQLTTKKYDMKASVSATPVVGWNKAWQGTKYNATTGYGWSKASSVGGGTNGVVPSGEDKAVMGDYAYGVTAATFQVFVGAFQFATVNIYSYGTAAQGKPGVAAKIGNGPTSTLTTNGVLTISGTAGADGILNITFNRVTGKALWVVSAIEVEASEPV